MHTRYNPLKPSFFQVLVKQSIGPLNLVTRSSNCACRRTLQRSNGCSNTLDAMPAI